MKRKVQFLLIVAGLASLLAVAEEETMEARKQRIKRKYLRERADITYSDEVVPGADAGDEEVTASEQYMEPQGSLEAHDQLMPAPMPAPIHQAPPLAENRNWLLIDDAETTDPYAAGPYGRKEEEDPAKQSGRPLWGTEYEPTPYRSALDESRFNWREDATSRQSSEQYNAERESGVFNPRNPAYGEEMRSPYPQQDGTVSGMEGSRTRTGTSFYNPDPEQPRFWQPAESRQDPTITGPSRMPYTSGDTPYGNPSRTQQDQQHWNSYTPYKSPYETQQEQSRQQRWNGYTSPYETRQEQSQQRGWNGYTSPYQTEQEQSQQGYQRPNTLQQWKQRNPSPVNPRSDDAYLQELSPRR